MASGLILLPVYTKYLSTEVYGAAILYMAFSQLIQIITTYSFDTSIYGFYHDFKNDNSRLSRFVSSAFIFVLIVSLITGLILVVSGEWIFSIVFTESRLDFYPFGFVSVLTGVFQSIYKVNSNLLQTQEKAGTFLIFNLVSFILIAVFTIAGLIIFPNDLTGAVGGRMVATMLTGIWVLFVVFRQYGFAYDFKMIQSTFGFNHPSLLYQIMLWFNGYFDRVMMTFYLPLSQVGIYDLAAKCLFVIEYVLAGFNSTFFPKVLGAVALQTKKGTTVEINRYYNGLTATSITLVVLSILTYPYLIRIFIQKLGFLAAITLIPFLSISYLFRALRMYMAMPYPAIRYSKPVPFFYAAILGVKILSMLLFLPRYGMWGVIYSTWISYTVEITVLYFGVKNKFAIKFNFHKLISMPLGIALLIVGLETYVPLKYELLLHVFYVVTSTIILFLLYRTEILNEWQKFDLKKLL